MDDVSGYRHEDTQTLVVSTNGAIVTFSSRLLAHVYEAAGCFFVYLYKDS